MTEKLYYQDAYLTEFQASVLSCEPDGIAHRLVLDRTAFFPEEGGQYSDGGTIGDARVLSVIEEGGTVVHLVDKPLPLGATVVGRIDFEDRFEKMQCHTAEHIVSGLLHSFFGCDNVGFHLGRELVTLDVNIHLTADQLARVELAANRAVFENVPVVVSYPSPAELATLEYRSKLDLTYNVRIVTVVGYDRCACCAPHVAASGEIGSIRLLDLMPHRGGTRITMVAGMRALRDHRARSEAVRRISAALSVPRDEVAAGVEKLLAEREELKAQYKAAREALLLRYAAEIEETGGNVVILCEGAEVEELRLVANAALGRVGGILVLLAGAEGAYRYLIVSESVDLRSIAAHMNASLVGRGGGKAGALQGSFAASLAEIESYFGVK